MNQSETTDGTGDYGEDEAEGTWAPVRTDATVTAYTPKVAPEENWMSLADAMKLKDQAFNAGMENAARMIFDRELCTNPEYVAEAIRREIK
jgi:hypothetical protein